MLEVIEYYRMINPIEHTRTKEAAIKYKQPSNATNIWEKYKIIVIDYQAINVAKIVNCIQFCTNINILTLGIIYAEFRSPSTTLKSEARPLNTFNPLCHE